MKGSADQRKTQLAGTPASIGVIVHCPACSPKPQPSCCSCTSVKSNCIDARASYILAEGHIYIDTNMLQFDMIQSVSWTLCLLWQWGSAPTSSTRSSSCLSSPLRANCKGHGTDLRNASAQPLCCSDPALQMDTKVLELPKLGVCLIYAEPHLRRASAGNAWDVQLQC